MNSITKILMFIAMLMHVNVQAQNSMKTNNENNKPRYAVWPFGGTITDNPVFLVELYTDGPGENEFPAFKLKNGAETVDLEVLETTQTEHTAQLLLKPSRPLTQGREYEFFFDGAGTAVTAHRLKALNQYAAGADFDASKRKWKVAAGKAGDDLYWDTEPYIEKVEDVFMQAAGNKQRNPVTSYFVFKYKMNRDVKDCLIKATVRDLKEGKETSYFFPNNGRLLIGYDQDITIMDIFDQNAAFDLRFEIVDSKGDALALTSVYTIISPRNPLYQLKKHTD